MQSIDAMAVIYMGTTLIWLLLALRFVNPTQIVARGEAGLGGVFVERVFDDRLVLEHFLR
ncbi:MAG: hypothetical protein WDN49_22165 [Acetobacteraceae bacterium]